MRNKRRWAWKKKHVRKHWTRSNQYRDTPPTWYRNMYHRGDRTKRRMGLGKVKRGIEDVDFSPRHHPSAAKWDWT